jgi:hypothetical protein
VRRFAGLLILCLMLAGAAPAVASGGGLPPIEDYKPTFTRAEAWLHGRGLPVGNLDAREGRFATWNGTKPTASQPVTYLSNNFNFLLGEDHDPAQFLTMQGKAKGDLENLAFSLYFIGWAQQSVGCGLSLSFQLKIDGVTILDQDYLGSDGILYEPTDDDRMVARFALTNIWKAAKMYGLEYGPDVEHDVYLNVQNFYLCNELNWYYGAASTPSGLVVNVAKPNNGYAPIDVLNPPGPPGDGARTALRLR